jgi:cytosine deaminase
MNLRELVLQRIKENGGWVNTHAHLDRAYSLDEKSFYYTNSYLKEKWHLVDEMKRAATVDIIYDRMERAVNMFLEQGTQAIGTFIDVDEVIQDRSLIAAQKLIDNYGKDIKIKFANQVLKGVIDPVAREWFDRSADFVDIIGGLPAKDFGREEEHLDILLSTAKEKNKLVHVHVDQFNTDEEKETELLARKTIEHGMQGKVSAVHSISVAAHPKKYRHELYKLMKEADLMVISCPTAWIDHNRTERLAPSHNSITPVDEMIPAGLCVAFGTDNINDIYKPFSDGDLWTELRVMLESCHFYDVDNLVQIATKNGLRVLGIE